MGQKEFHLFRIVIIYAVFGSLWILLSDHFLGLLVHDQATLVRLSEYKGLAFMAITTVLLFCLITQYLRQYRQAEDTLRQSEERFRSVFENAPIGMFQSTPAGQLVTVNRSAAAMFRYASPEDMIRRVTHIPSQLFVDPAHRERILRDALATPGFVCHETLFRRTDGSTFLANQYTRLVRDAAGHVAFIDGFVEDISQRKAAEGALRSAKDAAEAANRAKDQFIAVLSHELRTPLTPVLAQVELLQRIDGLDPEVREGLELIHRNIELEASLIADLFDVTKIIRGELRLELKPTDAHECLRAALEICRPQVQSHRHRVTLELQASQHYLSADPVRLRQIFWNLLGNAIKYTPDAGEVCIASCNTPQGKLRIEVRDNGQGMEPALMGRIFQPFVQGEQTLVRRFGGLGLGLNISKALAEALHGTLVAASSGKDQGSTFSLEFPVIPAPSASPSAAPCPPPSPPPASTSATLGPPVATGTSPPGRRILLVEDNVDTLRVMAQLLRFAGHQVQTAKDVKGAIRLATDQTFDLLISDIGLPDGTGWELLTQLNAQHAQRPIKALAFSGFVSPEDIQKSRAVGFLAHLAKPIDPARLEELIAQTTAETGGSL